MDRDVLMHRMNERFQELCGPALDALERAPEGQWIAASEWAFREAFQTLMQETFEAALQAKMDSQPTAARGKSHVEFRSDPRWVDTYEKGSSE